MLILHVFDHSLPLHSGYSFRSRAIIREQRALGWRTAHLTGPKYHLESRPREEVDGLLFYRTPAARGLAARLPALRHVAVMRALEARLEEVVELERPDLLHAHSPVLDAVPALRVGRRRGLPVVYEVRAFWEDAAATHGTAREWGPRYRASRALETWALRRADGVATICRGLRDEAVERGVDAARVAVVPNAVDVERFSVERHVDPELRRRLGLEDSIVVGFIGSFYAYEGLDLLLEALPAVRRRHPSTRLLLVGGGPEERRLRELTGRLDLADAVRFTGRVPHERVGGYYDLVDLFVYPRLSARLTELVTPLKPLEAMAKGRPVVASDVGGHRELIRPGETGILFPPDDVEALAATLSKTLGDRASWSELCRAARRFVEEERTWSRSVAGYRDLYARCLGPGKVP